MPVEIGHSRVLLVDTPGFDDTVRTDSEILTEIAKVLAIQCKLGVQLKGIVYLHRITDIRYSGASIKTFEICKKITGADALGNVVLATTRWHEVDQETGSSREQELREQFWAYMLGHGSRMSRFYGDRGSAVGILSQLLSSEPVVLELQRELVEDGKTLDQTTAGAFVEDHLDRLKERDVEDIANLDSLEESVANNRTMKKRNQKDREAKQAHVEAIHREKEQLRCPVNQEINQRIKKKSLTRRAFGFLPMAINLLAEIAGISLDFFPLLEVWCGDEGTGLDLDPLGGLLEI